MSNLKGKVISISSVKGGVGKTTLTMCLAGMYFLKQKKVLIIDLDLYSGGIAASLNVNSKKDIFMLFDAINNNRAVELKDYVAHYNKNIDVIAAPIDPRDASKISGRYIRALFEMASKEYDVILVDTNHNLDEISLTVLDNVYRSLFIITNDLVDLKNMKSLVSIFNDAGKTNYITLLNNSRDTGKDYLSLFDIKNIIKHNIDFIITKNFYIKNIDKYILKGDILTLNKNIKKFHHYDINILDKVADSLISDNHKEVNNNE